MLYCLSVNVQDGDFEFGENYYFESTPETFRKDGASEFLTAFAGDCPYCPGTQECVDCTEPDSGLDIRNKFLEYSSKEPLIVFLPHDNRSFRCDLEPVTPVLIHILNGRVEWVRHLPDPRWPWEVTYEWTNDG